MTDISYRRRSLSVNRRMFCHGKVRRGSFGSICPDEKGCSSAEASSSDVKLAKHGTGLQSLLLLKMPPPPLLLLLLLIRITQRCRIFSLLHPRCDAVIHQMITIS